VADAVPIQTNDFTFQDALRTSSSTKAFFSESNLKFSNCEKLAGICRSQRNRAKSIMLQLEKVIGIVEWLWDAAQQHGANSR
jgi:hypothetical protein